MNELSKKALQKSVSKWKLDGHSLEKIIESYLVLALLEGYPTDLTPEIELAITSMFSAPMIEETDAADEFDRTVAEMDAEKKEHRELIKRRQVVERHKTNEHYGLIIEAQKEQERLQKAIFLQDDPDEISELQKKNIEAFSGYKNAPQFIGPMFDGIVPMASNELMGIFSKTGGGKTTTVANIAWSMMKQANKLTGVKTKTLIISNEESDLDCYNRVACLAMSESSAGATTDWYYPNRKNFTEAQVHQLNEVVGKFRRSGLLKVIGPDYMGESGFTNKLENVLKLLDEVAARRDYDCIIIDYYQLINTSVQMPGLDEWKVQAKFASVINSYRDRVGCPIILMGQIYEMTKEQKPFNQRIVGTKAIAQPCTVVVEVVNKKDTYTTEWVMHKTRYVDGDVGKVVTGFRDGMVVPINDEKFKISAERKIRVRVESEQMNKAAMATLELLGTPASTNKKGR